MSRVVEIRLIIDIFYLIWNRNNAQKGLTKEEEDLLDARTIFKYKTIRKLRPDI